MDEDEYKKLYERKRHLVRFSNIKGINSGERRMTIFNPLDPNNA
jgi:hypothetical protein